MLLSVFTPTHDPTYLRETYETLKEQTNQNFEWVILPNGNAPVAIPPEIAADPQVRILRQVNPGPIGFLKRLACEQARGDILVELDHDDWLTPKCLETIELAQASTNADFLFSDNFNFRADGSCHVYDAVWGWESYKTTYKNKTYIAMKSFDVTARSLCEIFYAPNHVRAWTADAYWKVGGHDPSLAVGDDHDLIIRTYLKGLKFHHIQQCLYCYREHPNNSYLKQNAAVQTQQKANCDKYLHDLVIEECRRNAWPMLDLGGAHGCPREKGFLSVDRHQPADIPCDILQGIPVEDNSVGCFRASDFLEHVPIGQVTGLMNQLYRKLRPGGWLLSTTPSVSGPDGKVGLGAYQDPTHCSFWSQNNFWYYTDRFYANYVPEIQTRFQAARLFCDYPSEWHQTNSVPYVHADLLAIKPGYRLPGQARI